VTVVIPVKDRRVMLGETLDALDAQTFTDFEVVVVDDGSSDGSGEEAARRVVAGRPVTVVAGGGNGAVAARIAGLREARGDVFAFTDSDCVPSPSWLAEGMAAVDAGADVVNGRTVPVRDMLPLERSMWSGEEGLYPTCNMLYRRSAYEAVGGFDGAAADRWGFRPDRRTRGDGFGEDTLLAWRVARRGGTVTYRPEALVRHAVFPAEPGELAELLSRTARVGGFPALVKEIPELRGTPLIRWGWQLGRRTRLPLYGLVVSAVVRRPRLAALFAGWWLWLRVRDLRGFPISWKRRLAVLPLEMGVDVVTAAALVAGSAKARSVTL
jgi:glycosyltransferase involved in cell wall biosynthesis